jgi:hypothetical protein
MFRENVTGKPQKQGQQTGIVGEIPFWLVVSNMSYFQFHIWDVILPIDELIFFKMVIAPPTSMLGGHGSKWSKPRMNIHKSHRSFSVFIRVPSDLTNHYT